MRFWEWYAINVLRLRGDVLPPHIDGLLSWSALFKNHKTFGNYVTYVKLACEIKGVSLSVFSHPSLRRAKEAIEKRRLVKPRKPTWIRLALLQHMVTALIEKPELRELMMLYLASYIFLLRLPSQ